MTDEPASKRPTEPRPATPEDGPGAPFWLLVAFGVVVAGLIVHAMLGR